ncbi:NYN domain-containing protein [Aliiroseovarius crassostreae]|uniref:NYN domain-containing protein n=1 Tax=Aliiroseovarius crassostreae TaxID=154981 RepID=A0A0P7IZ07_9RHOB|nr:NYN domain-containing protein [Aliiroseovarius crassostreae]KPN64039.1 hypothetical protein AKJ29_15365 [Aliiroseovarius crassostreae]SFU27597.1 NYN domain-containing protein [Aliiroseovarius crassostreae]
MGISPSGDSIWSLLDRKGFNPTVYERNASNKEKKVDVGIAHRITKDAYSLTDKDKDDILLVAGGTDYIAVVPDLVAEAYTAEVAFWDHLARDLQDVSSNWIGLKQRHKLFTL